MQNNLRTREFLEKYSGSLNLNYVDAFSSGKAIPEKLAGVGFARKIGLDISLTKYDYSSSSKKLLIWLDADCEVDQNYLEVIVNSFNKNNLSSAVVEYEHKIDDSKPESKAIVCYETFLRYLKLALTYANSHYNYHVIGSTIVCEVESYIKAGGMNSGEDFTFWRSLQSRVKLRLSRKLLFILHRGNPGAYLSEQDRELADSLKIFRTNISFIIPLFLIF